MFKKIISLFLAAVLLFSLCSCMERGIEDPIKTKPDDGTFAMKISALEARSADDEFKNAYNDFALDMFKKSISSERNSLISPLSVYIALSMLANGAKNETLTELEELLGMETGELNNYLYDYVSKLPEGDGFKMNSANSFWYKNTDSFRVNEGFKELMSTCFNADVMGKNFSRETCDEMNEWVSDKTDGMISKLIDTIPPTAVAYLINAIAFEAEWKVKYTLGDVRDRDFHNIDGT
ncbi:MAG: serine protease, partial [Ruminococcaceae bacterium]|nr:serine protease [Oscillospiraceae bacterium]